MLRAKRLIEVAQTLGLAFTLTSVAASGQTQSPNKPQEVTLLEQVPIERELAGGQRHVYLISLPQEGYAKVVIKQMGVNVGVMLRLPNGETVQAFEAAVLTLRELPIGWVAESSGNYQLEVYATAKAPAGRYEIRIVELRAATDDDRELQRARDLYLEHLRLHRQGKYIEARAPLIKALAIRERVLGPNDILVAKTLGYLGLNYENTGEFASAEPLLLRELRVIEKALGSNHPQVGVIFTEVGGFYLKKGDYLKSEENHLKALAIFERAQLTETNEVAASLTNLGSIYYARGDLGKAEHYYQKSRAVLEKIFGAEHFHLADSYSVLGRVAYDTGDYAKAEEMFSRALAISEKALKPDHLVVTRYRNDLAAVYSTTGEYAKAEALYRQSLSTHEQKAAMTNPNVHETLYGLGRLFAARGMPAAALQFQSRASELEERYIDLNLGAGSEREKLAFLEQTSRRSSRHISLHTQLAPNDAAARDLAVITILRRKGRVQDALSESMAALRRRFGPEEQKLLDQLNETTSNLANLVLYGRQKMTTGEHQEKITTLEQEREKLEAEISRHSSGFYQRFGPITADAIQKSMPPGTALIEFAVYRPFAPNQPDNESAYAEPHYVAYIIPPQGEIQWRELGEAKPIDDAVNRLRQALHDPQSQEVRRQARALDERVMQPVRALLGDATHLLVSPDGQLNLVPFEALVDESENFLIRRYSFTYVTSGRDLLRMQTARASKSPTTAPLIVANPSFGEPAAEQVASLARPPARRRRSVTAAGSLSEIYFAPLSGTAREANTIKKIFPEANLLTEAQATESALKLTSAPRMLHIATHGFFLSEPGAVATGSSGRGQSGVRAENPLLRSGLALTNANLRSSTGDDGILTALEASGLNLWGTKLVVLSACDTGLGEVRNGEGVYGLRRAFVLAGAESLVMSLWPVSDYPTERLMTEFYQNLKQGMGRGEALRQAQLHMVKENLHPFYWANFIQSGDWANLEGKR